MPAKNETYPWLSHYGDYFFFERVLKNHSKIAAILREDPAVDGVYRIELQDGRGIRIFICECYVFGIAELIEVQDNLGEIDGVIINSSWCSYTKAAKKECIDTSIGLFDIGDFMAAIHQPEFWLYLNDQEKEYFEKHGWT